MAKLRSRSEDAELCFWDGNGNLTRVVFPISAMRQRCDSGAHLRLRRNPGRHHAGPLPGLAGGLAAIRHRVSEDRFYAMGGMPTDKIVIELCGEAGRWLDVNALVRDKALAFERKINEVRPIARWWRWRVRVGAGCPWPWPRAASAAWSRRPSRRSRARLVSRGGDSRGYPPAQTRA